ncbi:hypothetical protein GDO86_006280 [Hymenochirus boettgeri]|uniref:WD repeat-containing protein 72 n=1 Tax=Hymenochirus boettgeri TaxID=247094 RepID=A0A8T2J7X9_9PIPI|nr:hypothetical protein GDO86_006280 [Hymenochirus boettgeri]
MKHTIQAVALWGNVAPSHSITSMMITEDQKNIVTGSLEGQICLWHLSQDMKITSKAILFGHTTAVTCLAKARDFEKKPYVVSGTENGEMCVWNVSNGQCIENAKLPYRHTAVCYYYCSFRMTGEGWLLCCGYYQDVLVIDAKTLQVLNTFQSHVSDWISCMYIVHSTRIQEDSLVAISVAGDLKVWDLSSSVNSIQEKEIVYESESKLLEIPNCCVVRFCTFTERLLLVVCSDYWKIFDYCDFNLLCTEACKSNQLFSGGEFLATNRLIIWTEDGHSYIYQLLNSGHSKSIGLTDGGLPKEIITPHLLCSTKIEEKSFSFAMGFLNERKEPFFKILYSGDASGRISLWHIPDVPVSQFDGSPLEIQRETTITLQEIFDNNKTMSEGIIDHLCTPEEGIPYTTITSSIYIPNLDKLVCGYEDGKIVITFALHAARARLFKDYPTLKGSLPYKIYEGHNCSVESLLYPHGQMENFDPSWLISGDLNSVVIWRDVFTGEIFHKFFLQAGSIMKLLVPSDDCKVKLFQCVYCICSDNSVALLNLQERICFFHARKHLFSVTTLKWHPIEDVLIVGCEDGSVYIWEIETGRDGKAILTSYENFNITMTDSIIGSSKETQGNTKTTYKSSNSYKLGSMKRINSSYVSKPFTVAPVKAKYNISLHLLLFDLEKMLEHLQSFQVKSLKSANSFSGYDVLKTGKSSSEKRQLILKRNKTAGSFYQTDGQMSDLVMKENTSYQSEELGGIKRNKKIKSSKKQKFHPAGKIDVNMTSDATKLFLSCLLPWGLEKELDIFCVTNLDILKTESSVAFGVVSNIDYLGLMLPGWNQTSDNNTTKSLHNMHSKKVMELSTKYYAATHKQITKPENKQINTANLGTLSYFLERLCTVSKALRMEPFSKINNVDGGQEKMESIRGKWRSSEHFSSFSVFAGDLQDKDFPDPESISLFKLISSWKDQSVQVIEAMQAVLFVELQSMMQASTESIITTQPVSTLDNVDNGHVSQQDPSNTIELQPISAHSVQSPGPVVKYESTSKSVKFQEDEVTQDKSEVEDVESPDDMQSNDWMSKVCYCKIC